MEESLDLSQNEEDSQSDLQRQSMIEQFKEKRAKEIALINEKY